MITDIDSNKTPTQLIKEINRRRKILSCETDAIKLLPKFTNITLQINKSTLKQFTTKRDLWIYLTAFNDGLEYAGLD